MKKSSAKTFALRKPKLLARRFAVVLSLLLSGTSNSESKPKPILASPLAKTFADCFGKASKALSEAKRSPQCKEFWSEAKPHISCSAKVPLMRASCGYEICECRTGYSLATAAKLYAEASTQSRVIDRLPKGTRFKNRELYTKVTKLGLGFVAVGTSELWDWMSLDQIRVVETSTYFGEGEYEICEGDKFYSSSESGESTFQSRRDPNFEAWAKVSLKNNKTGWVELKAIKSIEGDRCDFDGGPTQ